MSAQQRKIKDRLEEVIDEMVCKGIHWTEAAEQFEKLFLLRALRESNGRLNRTAEIMGLHRNTISKKIRAHGLQKKT